MFTHWAFKLWKQSELSSFVFVWMYLRPVDIHVNKMSMFLYHAKLLVGSNLPGRREVTDADFVKTHLSDSDMCFHVTEHSKRNPGPLSLTSSVVSDSPSRTEPGASREAEMTRSQACLQLPVITGSSMQQDHFLL